MATDYDAPRRRVEDELEADSLEGLKAAETDNNGMDDDGEIVEAFQPPTVDLTGEELNVTVIPRQEDEFTCSSCFLIIAFYIKRQSIMQDKPYIRFIYTHPKRISRHHHLQFIFNESVLVPLPFFHC